MDISKNTLETRTIEILEFSKEHSKHIKKASKESTGYYTRSFYQGREFTSRRKVSDGEYHFSDKKLIFKGCIDELLVKTEVEY